VTGKITVSGEVHLAGFEVLPEGARGAAVVVAGPGGDPVSAARLAPAAVLVLVDGGPDDVAAVLAATLWPRPRVIGVSQADVPAAVRAIAGDSRAVVKVVLADGGRELALGRCGVLP
jgi:hypothetical protein